MYNRQFLISARSPACIPAGWKVRPIAGMVLHHAPDLPVIEFAGPDGEGLLLGWPICRGRMWTNGETLRLAAGEGPPLLNPVSGRFLALVAKPDGVTCHLDPCGFLPAVYDRTHGMLASTPGLLPIKDDEAGFAFRAAFDIPARSSWYPFGLTGSPGVRRLLPGHCLDLRTFAAHRYWPVAAPPEEEDAEVPARVARIGQLLRENVTAVAACDEVVCNLTAGRDTRMILAALRDQVDRVGFTTIRLPDKMGEQDCLVAGQIAARLGLAHQEIGCDEPLQTDIDEWLTNAGFCVGGRTLQLATTAKRIARLAKFNLTGLGGDIGRGVDWLRGDHERNRIDVGELLERLGLDVPLIPEVDQAGQRWLAGLPQGPVTRILDLALIELTLACCSCPSFYGHCHGGVSISPFNDRRIIDQMLALPPAYRSAQKLARDLIDLMWPELNQFLFNPMTTRRRLVRRQQVDILRRRIARAFGAMSPGKTRRGQS